MSSTPALPIDETLEFRPRYDQNGLITCVVECARSGRTLMVAYMNENALALTLQTGEAHYWSRSRQEIWHKGATSGNTQSVVDIRIDCDQDCLLMRVNMPPSASGHAAACHTGRESCFYRKIVRGQDGAPILAATDR